MLYRPHKRSALPVCLGLAAITLSGCANTTAMRGLASNTSSALSQDSGMLAKFVATGQQAAQDRAATLSDLQNSKAENQTAVDRMHNAWTLAGRKDELAMLSQVQRVQPADIVSSLPAPTAATPALDDGGAGASLDKAAATYKAMAAAPKTKDRLKEIFAAGQAVQQATQAIKAKAATSNAD